LKPKADIPEPNVLKTLEKLTAHAFCYRRKMLRSSLGRNLPQWQKICTSLNIDETKRPEELDVQTFVSMAKLCNINS
jgi:16S rRNA A1518/A1519 N6-dimethyltransferase RsmA/KsgA/DIM1 with predicted DNA glycosylase/AP lyase activity